MSKTAKDTNDIIARVDNIKVQKRMCSFTYGELELFRLAEALAQQLSRYAELAETMGDALQAYRSKFGHCGPVAAQADEALSALASLTSAGEGSR